jgi:hypothetical protein
MPLQFPAQDEGVYWFEISLDDAILTRVPLRVAKHTVAQSIPPQLPA